MGVQGWTDTPVAGKLECQFVCSLWYNSGYPMFSVVKPSNNQPLIRSQIHTSKKRQGGKHNTGERLVWQENGAWYPVASVTSSLGRSIKKHTKGKNVDVFHNHSIKVLFYAKSPANIHMSEMFLPVWGEKKSLKSFKKS